MKLHVNLLNNNIYYYMFIGIDIQHTCIIYLTLFVHITILSNEAQLQTDMYCSMHHIQKTYIILNNNMQEKIAGLTAKIAKYRDNMKTLDLKTKFVDEGFRNNS